MTETISSGNIGDALEPGRLIVAVPVLGGERVVGAIRASRSTGELNERVLHSRLLIGGAAIVIAALAALAALALSRRLSRPLGELAEAAATLGTHGSPAESPRSGIRELDIVADALDALVARLDALLARERSFSANASHQLRTPLAALRLDLESRQLGGAELDEAIAQVDRLERTIETLLAASRDRPADREPFVVDDLLEEIRQQWVGPLAAAGRALEVGAGRDGSEAAASRSVVREVIDVLVDNARRHGRGTVGIRGRVVGGMRAIDVIDRGPGVERPDELFVGRHGATHGIGLAIARSLAEGEGGRLELTANGGGATTFTLLLRAPPAPVEEGGKHDVP